MDYNRKKMKHGGKHSRDEKRMGMVYGSMAKRMPKNMGGVANAQPMYSEDMPKAMPN